MKAVVHVNNLAHQQTHAAAIAEGLARHGWDVGFARYGEPTGEGELAVIWGWKQPAVIADVRERGGHVLVMERGFVGDRIGTWTSCGLDGLNGRALWPDVDDGGARWRRFHDGLLQPWRSPFDGPVLVCGQVPGDASLYGRDLTGWAVETVAALRALDREVVYRPHPLVVRQGEANWCPPGARLSTAPIADDLARCGGAVTFNSNSGVEAVLAGVPTVTGDEGAVAWPVTSHEVGTWCRPTREAWAHRLAWCQWTLDEIASGDAWDALRGRLRRET